MLHLLLQHGHSGDRVSSQGHQMSLMPQAWLRPFSLPPEAKSVLRMRVSIAAFPSTDCVMGGRDDTAQTFWYKALHVFE
ncbi:hypothetical protein MHYP_G00080010 [Metynnis hypsauchen]